MQVPRPRSPSTQAETRRHGRRLQREIGAAAGDPADFGERLGAAAFERMRGTEFASESQPAGEPIDGDDRIAACDARRH
jgi:hypothetical protein